MAVEIKITGETAEKGYNELKQLASLIFGNRQEPIRPEPTPDRPDPKPEKKSETVDQPEEGTEIVPKNDLPAAPPTTKRTRNSNKAKQEETKPATEDTKHAEETKPVEEVKSEEVSQAPPIEETKPVEESKPEEPAGNSVSPYPAPFDKCANETEVVNMVRERVAVVMGNPETEAKAKAIFMEYKKPTVLKLSLEEKMDFFNKIADL